jgi:nicotinamide-nucleotide amidase
MGGELTQLAIDLNNRLRDRGLLLASAESCTGGWIAKAMTDVPGCSGCFECAFVTYSNEAKYEMLGVPLDTLEQHGAVSEAVVREMVQGALRHSRASVAVAVSGIAGPGGGSAEKPVGTVWLAWGLKAGEVMVANRLFVGDRDGVRYQSSVAALRGVFDLIGRS